MDGRVDGRRRQFLKVTGIAATGLLAESMAQVVRMFEPHEAREDTVLFPAFRTILPPKEFLEMGEKFEDTEQEKFGKNGFDRIVAEVAGLEQTLGIEDLAQFQPKT